MVNRISILGCGWLGFPLAKQLLKEGYSVKGSTTTPEKVERLNEAGIEGSLLKLEPGFTALDPAFLETDCLLVNIPPGRGRDNVASYHLQQFSHLTEAVQRAGIKKVIMISATSVYPSGDGHYDEKVKGTPARPSGEALLQAEDLIRNTVEHSIIIRFCGLFGGERHPARFLSGKKLEQHSSNPVNMIHLEDCINIIAEAVKQQAWGETFNACAPRHPERIEFYEAACGELELPLPQFNDELSPVNRTINSAKLVQQLNYEFIYPDPVKAFRNAQS